LIFNDGSLVLGAQNGLDSKSRKLLEDAVRELIPWRKGPFKLFDYEINSEWRSDKKWNRLSSVWGSLAGKRVADVGCGNGYYMFRALEHDPECVIGFDGSEIAFYQFELIQRFIQAKNLQIEPFRDDYLENFQNFFDVIFCLGVVYHHRSPMDLINRLFRSLRRNGRLVIESQTYPGEQNTAFFNPDRYAKARNIYFVPTASCLASWVWRSGFEDVEILSEVEVGADEQRKTQLAPFESLEDYLDPNDKSKTVEGFLAPKRAIVCAKKCAMR
jgi:tRNA (mo5U34)-methyltransferase